MKAVILAGGLGTRLAEETGLRPKPLVEVGGKPILWHILKIYSAHGINDFVICLGYKGHMIKQYFADYLLTCSDVTIDMNDCSVTLVDTGSGTGTGGRLRSVAKYLQGERTFCMTYGDGVADVDLSALIEFHQSHGKAVTITAVQPVARFGALGLEHHKVLEFQEKPQDEGGWVNGGFMVLDPVAINAVTNDDEMFEQEPMERLVKEGEVQAFFHHGFWQAMDTLRDKQTLEKMWEKGDAKWIINDKVKNGNGGAYKVNGFQ
ncbi:glucose-1-phosphate cytidylyltransferase [Kockovaella imperatae]|uniref:Glucose-1-phosphate cytidylyltransferase n=1 Tax=Kockovaella imperatae TaxID=4999 RepID=A0A1Y1UBE8_9TREE|nr:glucose-1-phosphate cytidylyltransferase [Kockovaella imperatae]ORX35371.1 glucose-1-phosphate cytidylyltransferase [Kockovaella imperatae]